MTNRILVVDDDRAMVGTLCDILELHGWNTQRAYDGSEAADLVVEHEIDIALMDVRMPGVNGVEALRQIKSRRPRTRVVLMTAYAAPDLLDQAERDGVLSILAKPVKLPELLELLTVAAKTSRSLLVVDDDPEYLSSLCDALSLKGVETTRAHTLSEAIGLLRGGLPHAVLLDLKLEHVDPKTSVLAVRQASPSVMLILYSGHDAELARTLEEMPPGLVDAAFMKPLPIETLVGRLNQHVRN